MYNYRKQHIFMLIADKIFEKQLEIFFFFIHNLEQYKIR